MGKKKKLIIIIACAAAAVVLGLFLWKFLSGGSSGERKAFVMKVDDITGRSGSVNRFTGQVVSQDTVTINKDSDKTVKEILVEAGDTVKKDQPLFTYDLDELNLALEQGQLDVDLANQNIADLEQQVAELIRARSSAPQSEQLEYTIQIQSAQNDIRKAKYELEQKKLNLEELKKSAGDNTVRSPMDGVIKSINTSDQQEDPYGYGGGQNAGFITIMSVGDYRIKGKINEQNVYQINVGDRMIIHSRVDDTVWYGTISKIDTDSNTNENNNNYDYYEYGMSQGEGSSSYPFYVEVEDPEGLMMGQHVYMEQDLGQGAARTGIWLMSGYLMQEDGDYYVWAEDGDRLEKRKVTVGEYDEMTDEYQILEGLSGSDRIAWP
ncbi:MAG: HlyD family efflux transporter periplasmic adaptor subunit, partial [Lachnospiraceae bacterium]|nr:HlyD family efflux transporter periplasmic adaptor subunit [Lachnospiraceae bacterium]